MTSERFREALLYAGFGRYDDLHASGEHANNKLSLGYDELSGSHELCGRIVYGLSGLAAVYKPDLLLSVPSGPDEYARRMGRFMGVRVLVPYKDPETKEISVDEDSEKVIEASETIVLVEDVPNSHTNTRKVLALQGVEERVVALAGIWDRGNPSTRKTLPNGIKTSSMVTEFIPARLRSDSGYWKYAGSK